MGSFFSNLFGGGGNTDVTPAPVAPVIEDNTEAERKKKEQLALENKRKGLKATVMTDEGDLGQATVGQKTLMG